MPGLVWGEGGRRRIQYRHGYLSRIRGRHCGFRRHGVRLDRRIYIGIIPTGAPGGRGPRVGAPAGRVSPFASQMSFHSISKKETLHYSPDPAAGGCRDDTQWDPYRTRTLPSSNRRPCMRSIARQRSPPPPASRHGSIERQQTRGEEQAGIASDNALGRGLEPKRRCGKGGGRPAGITNRGHRATRPLAVDAAPLQ